LLMPQILIRDSRRYLRRSTMQTGDALEPALALFRINQIEHALEQERRWRLADIDVPVDHAVVVVFGMGLAGRRLEVGAVDVDPEVVAPEQLAEELIERRILANIPERLVVIHLDHPVDAVRVAVPVGGIVAVELEEVPDRVDDGVNLFGRNQLSDDEVAILVEECAISFR